MEKIVPHLWYDKKAKEAAEFYTSLFPDSKVTNVTTLHNTPSGDRDIISFKLFGHPFMAISAGPLFKFNPSISFMVNFDPSQDKDAKIRIDEVWAKLSEGGKVLMPIDKYPFSERYGWIQDKYGLSWQLILTNPKGEERPMIIPSILFVGDAYGKTEEAVNFYLSVFAPKGSQKGTLMKYGPGQESRSQGDRGSSTESGPNKEGTVMFSDFKLLGTWFSAMDGGGKHDFAFNEAISFIVKCQDQQEIDYYWEKLSAVPESEQCGWLKDKYGVSWQIVPTAMDEMMAKGTPEQIDRITQAFLPMKKFDIETLQKAYEGK